MIFFVFVGILKNHLVIEKCLVCGFVWKFFWGWSWVKQVYDLGGQFWGAFATCTSIAAGVQAGRGQLTAEKRC